MLRWDKLTGLLGYGLLISGLVVVTASINQTLKIDPFADKYGQRSIGLPDEIGVKMSNVTMRHYRGKSLSAKAKAREVTISRDRTRVNLVKVNNGVMYSDQGQVQFTAGEGEWSSGFRNFILRKQVRVWDKNVDLTSSVIQFEQRQNRIKVDNPIQGNFFGGQLQATNLVYNIGQDYARGGAATWVGTLAGLQDIASSGRSSWEIKGKTFTIKKGVAIYTEATARDAENFIKAPKVEWNRKTDVLVATGRVFYYSQKANVIADKVIVYRKEKRAVLIGNVQMLVKPKDREVLTVEEIPPFRPLVPDAVKAGRPSAPASKEQDDELRDPKSIRSYPLAMSAPEIEYFYAKGRRRANVSGGSQARQELSNNRWRHAWASTAIWDGENETLRLNSSTGKRTTRFKTSLGDDLLADWIKFSVKEGADDDLEGEQITGQVYSTDDDVNDLRSPPPATTGGGGSTGGSTGGTAGGGLKGPIGRGL